MNLSRIGSRKRHGSLASFFQSVLLLAALATPATAQITAESEPNDTAANASGPLQPGRFVNADAANNNDLDFYYYDIPAAGKLTAGVHFPKGATFHWTLRNDAGTTLQSSSSGTRPEVGSVQISAGEIGKRYTIEVQRQTFTGSALSSSSYQLCISFLENTARPAKPGTITNYFTGTSTDSDLDPFATGGPACLLMGGGSEVDNAFRNQAFPIINGGNIVVLRVTGTNGYQTYFSTSIYSTGPLKPASVETIILDSVSKANTSYVQWALERAEMIWMAGGDQSDYTANWKGTATERAINSAYNRGAVIGGTSAGAVVCSQYVYDPAGVTAVTSDQAVVNPYRSGMLFTTDFLQLPIMRNILVDSHVDTRTRLGRTSAFMARMRKDGIAEKIFGVAVGEGGSFFINRDRIGTSRYSPYPTWVLYEDAQTILQQCVNGQNLVYTNLLRNRMTNAGPPYHTYDFNDSTPTAGGWNIRVSVNGTNYTPADWYDTLPVALSLINIE